MTLAPHAHAALLVGALRPGWSELPRAERGEGVYVYDHTGIRYLDATCGNYCAILGHGVPEVIEAITAQLTRITICGLPAPTLDALTRLLVALAPDGISHVHLTNSGSEAIEAALLLARQVQRDRGYADRFRFLSFQGAFHGSTFGARSATGVPALRHGGGWSPLLLPFRSLPRPSLRDWQQVLLHLEQTIAAEGAETLAALLIEPFFDFGEAPPEFFATAAAICRRAGILVIADEVRTGFGRTGRMFASEVWAQPPDIITFGKAVNGGFTPLAGMLVARSVFETVRDHSGGFPAGHTTAGNPLSCAAALSVLRYLLEHDLLARVTQVGERLQERLPDLVARHASLASVHGAGAFWMLELSTAEGAPAWGWTDRFGTLQRACLAEGVLAWPVLCGPHVGLCLAPAYVISDEEIDELVESLDAVFTSLER